MGSVSLRGIEKYYGDTKVIHAVDLDVADGEFLVFVGPSGCGKSTILRMIAGLEEISGGEIRIGGVLSNEVAPAQRGAAMVFQNYALYPHMTVAENMGFALKLAKVSRREIGATVRAASEILRIEHLLDRKPKELSGGERQRVAIGRAIVRKPKVFLFDEPLSNLDAALRVQMRLELSRLHRELGTTMIYVTHDQVEAMTMGDRIAVFNAGRIEQVGAPADLYARPANRFVAGFLGSPKMNFVKGTLEGRDGDTWRIGILGGQMLEAKARNAEANAGREVVVGVRPEHLEVVSPEAGAGATVSLVEHLGDCAILHVSVGDQEPLIAIRVPAEGSVGLSIGSRIGIRPCGAGCVVFDGDGRAAAYSGARARTQAVVTCQ